MNFLLLGVNHQTAPLQLREKVAFQKAAIEHALLDLYQKEIACEAVILSTCNRTEIYCYSHKNLQAIELCTWLEEIHQLPQGTLCDAVYFYKDEKVVEHIMCVASGLDSQVLGETQIQGQMKQALLLAQHAGMVQGILGRLFEKSFVLAKQVRSKTDIGQYSVSVAYTSVCLARHVFDDLSRTTVMLIGSGQTIDLVAHHLQERGVKKVYVANRTLKHAHTLAARFDGEVLVLEEIKNYLAKVDIVISATASPAPLISHSMVSKALKNRKLRPMLLIDLAVPRDIAQDVEQLPDAYLYTIDDLNKIVEKNIKHREDAASQAKIYVHQAVQDFFDWYQSLESGRVIAQIREQAKSITEREVKRAVEKLAQGMTTERVVHELSHKLTNKLLHAPTKALNHAGKTGRKDMLAYLVHALGGVQNIESKKD